MGTDALAFGTDATAIGSGAFAERSDTVAIGSGAYAFDFNNVAVGANARATALNSTAFGQSSNASGTNSSSIGQLSRATGVNSTTVGTASEANGTQSTALGVLAIATRDETTAIGAGSSAFDVGTTAIGANARANGVNSTAIGRLAEADFAGSTAVGANARTTETNQVMLGGAGSSVVIGDLDASTAAQVGPVDVVTVDANGTLGRQQVASAGSVENVRTAMNALAMVSDAQFDALSTRVAGIEFALEELDNRSRGGIAAAMAMGGMMVVPDSNVSFSASVSTFEGEQGFAGGVSARLAEKVYISASVAGSTTQDSTGGRVSVAFGF